MLIVTQSDSLLQVIFAGSEIYLCILTSIQCLCKYVVLVKQQWVFSSVLNHFLLGKYLSFQRPIKLSPVQNIYNIPILTINCHFFSQLFVTISGKQISSQITILCCQSIILLTPSLPLCSNASSCRTRRQASKPT